MERILITGGKGMLATEITTILANNFIIINPDKSKLDITNKEKVQNIIDSFKPNYVIHTAALTNVDFCEDAPELARQTNELATETLAFYTEKIKAKFIYISTCGLFGDIIRPYSEIDTPTLKTQYAKSKYGGEIKTKEHSSKHFIIRPGWLFGGTKEHKKNFVYNRYLEAQKQRHIYSAIDKYGCPTYTKYLARKIVEIMGTDCYDTFHVTSSNYCTRYDYVKKIISCLNLNTTVQQTNSSSFSRKAPVPDCEILSNNNLVRYGFSLLPSWESSLEEYIFTLQKHLSL